ncbi:unnamed protein product [Prunus armeniaca]
MFLRGVKPDLVTYNSLINSLCHSVQWKEATRLCNRMLDEGIAPDVVTFNTRMLDEGIAPDVVTFNTVIDALCKERRTKEALSVLELMSHRGMRLGIVTYNSLIYGMCLTDQWDETTRLFDEMVGQGVLPDIITLRILLDALFQGRMPEEAHKVLETRVKYGMELSKITCSMLIDGYCFRGKMDKAKKDPNPKETIDLEKLMLGCIGLHAEVRCWVDLGFSVLATTLKHGLQHNAYTLTALLHGVCKYRSISEAMQLFRKI